MPGSIIDVAPAVSSSLLPSAQTRSAMQRQELLADKNIDMRPVRVRTGRMFLDGFAAIRAQEAELDLPIFAAMSPTDQARRPLPCLPSIAGNGIWAP